MKVFIQSIPHTAGTRAEWPDHGTPCPHCGEPMGGLFAKMVKDWTPDSSRLVVHKKCSDGSYLKRGPS